jgi:hypothetical protein
VRLRPPTSGWKNKAKAQNHTVKIRNRWHLRASTEYKSKLTEQLQTLKKTNITQMSEDQLWENVKAEIERAAEGMRANQKPQRKKIWIRDETWEVIEQRKRTKQRGLDKEEIQQSYH